MFKIRGILSRTCVSLSYDCVPMLVATTPVAYPSHTRQYVSRSIIDANLLFKIFPDAIINVSFTYEVVFGSLGLYKK